VLPKAGDTNEAWVGLICEFLEDEDKGKVANFIRFSTENEIRNKERKEQTFCKYFNPLHLIIRGLISEYRAIYNPIVGCQTASFNQR
jgi:hypothetical protein